MNFKRLLNTTLGRFLISILLGLGLATMFRKACTDKNCITFHGPVLSEFSGKVYKHGSKCYQYSLHPEKCDTNKKIIELGEPIVETPTGGIAGL